MSNTYVCVTGAVLLVLVVALSLRTETGVPASFYTNTENQVTKEECQNTQKGPPRGALAFYPFRPSSSEYCWKQVFTEPLTQRKIPPGDQRIPCPPQWRAVYDQNTAQWMCKSKPVR